MSNTNTYIGMAIALFLSILTIYIVVREMIRSNIKWINFLLYILERLFILFFFSIAMYIIIYLLIRSSEK